MAGERYRDADSVSISLATQHHAMQRAAVLETGLKSFNIISNLYTYYIDVRLLAALLCV